MSDVQEMIIQVEREQKEQWIQAVAVLSTLDPTLEVNINDPIGMAQAIHQHVTAERDTANARAERAEKALEGAVEALRDLTGRAESFWALLQGDYGVKISSEDQEDHNVYEFFFAIERAKAIYLKEKEEK